MKDENVTKETKHVLKFLERTNNNIESVKYRRDTTESQLPYIFLKMLMFIFERERAQAGEGQREREIQNLKPAPGSELSAQSPINEGLKLTNCEIMTRAQVR